MRDHPEFKAYAALASVCFFWGTTYLAIRMALESFPPLLLISGRFLISGTLMIVLVRSRGYVLPRGRELLWTGAIGVMILGVGNGCLVYAERLIPSSLAALFITISPFWIVAIEAIVPGGDKLRAPTLVGMATGFCGAALLVAPSLMTNGMKGDVWRGFLILQLSSFSWSLGSILQKRHRAGSHPFATGAIQQFAAGLAFLIPALLSGNYAIHWSAWGLSGLLYLVIFGSLVGYSSYVYALEKLPVAMVSIYNYINPVVAAVLGLLFYREPFGARECGAMAIIFAGVAIVKRFSVSSKK